LSLSISCFFLPYSVENIVNSADAFLIDQCMREGFDPRSSEAPQSMAEAMDRYFGMENGDPNSISSEKRNELSANIGVVATGDKKYPSITCFDKGTGQNPPNFFKSFLSLPGSEIETSKSGITFVQGLFNMGGSGVLPFCGDPKNDYNFKLIVSKRDPEISDADGTWGFTIIRISPTIGGHKSSTYVALAPNNKILTFKEDSLLILPGKYPTAYGQPLHWGTFIKLFNYQLPKPSIIVLELLYEIGHHLFRPALPVKMYERRTGYQKSHTLTNIMHGDIVKLKQNAAKIMEEGFPKKYPIIIPDIGEMSVSIFPLKSSVRSGYWLGFAGTHRVIFTVNGQMHETKKKDFLTSEKVDKAYLADDLLVVVDCDQISDRAVEKLFMPSRDRTRKNEVKIDVEQQLQNLLKHHEGLIELNNLRRAEQLAEARTNQKPLKSLINKFVKRSSAFSRLFNMGTEIELPYDFNWKKVKRKKYEPNDPPEFFRLKNDKTIYEIPPNKGASVYIETDAPNDFFDQKHGKGPYVTPKRFNHHHVLWNGILRLYLKPKAKLKPGEEISVFLSIKDTRVDDSHELKIKIKIIPQKEVPPRKPKEKWEQEKEYSKGDTIVWENESWYSVQDGNVGNQPNLSSEWWIKKLTKKLPTEYGRKKHEIESDKTQPMKSLPPYKWVNKDDDNWKRYYFDEGTGAHLV